MILNIESIDAKPGGRAQLILCRRTRSPAADLPYCSSPKQVPLQRSVINKKKERHELDHHQQKDYLVLLNRQQSRARTHTLSLPHPIVPVSGNPRDAITFRLVFRCAVRGNPLEFGG
ncbi:hypothetical protein PoB_004930600 [Plakobranchus ocellatus]|uniref:Uncharacterized protein n=1 Tax=Plakobranchus ocellatus TaxID=259542 RepID=A0AAV4BUS3_9GAST|nr:hypothetical protein PoB_004930600 [Plakobranchus ocellatus]